MAKDDPKPTEAPVTRGELLELVQMMIAANAAKSPPENGLTSDQVREIATAATLDAAEKASGKFWDERNYPRISAFNPLGDKDHPRDQIVGEVFWLGHLLQREELTQNEIALLNAIEPGRYGPHGDWVVIDIAPGVRDRAKRRLLVAFPCTDEAARARLPQGDFLGRQSGMEQMLEFMVGRPAPSLAAV